MLGFQALEQVDSCCSVFVDGDIVGAIFNGENWTALTEDIGIESEFISILINASINKTI